MKKFNLYSMLSLFTFTNILNAQQLAIPRGVLVESSLNAEFIAKFALFIAVLLIWTVTLGKVFKTIFHLPTIAGQIIAGVLLGPSGIDIASLHFFAEPIEMIDRLTGTIYALASSDLFVFFVFLLSSAFTVSYLLWIAGHETNIKDVVTVGLSAFTAGILGAIVPIAMTVAVAIWTLSGSFNLLSATGLGLALAATSVSIPVAMLFSQKKMHLRSSKAMLGAAIIDDIFAVLLLSVFFITVDMGFFGPVGDMFASSHHTGLINALMYLLLTFAIMIVFGYYIVRPLTILLHKKKLPHLIAPFANGVMFLYFALAELLGSLAGITGAYFAGLFHRMGDSRHDAEKTISPFVNAVLLPLFLCSIGLQVDVKILGASEWVIVLVLLVVAITSKIIGCYIATLTSNLINKKTRAPWTSLESYLFGSSMVARGEVGLVIATALNAARVVNSQQYVIAVIVIVLTTIVAPIMLSIGFSYEKPSDKIQAISLSLGRFKVLGTTRLFNIILERTESSMGYKTIVRLSEGRKIVTLRNYNVKMVLSPQDGIVLEGSSQHINLILGKIREAIENEAERLVPNEE